MRNVFLLLLLANLVFAMWWLWIEPTHSEAGVGAAPPLSAPRLVLLSEVDRILEGEIDAREVAGLALAAPEPVGPVAEGADGPAQSSDGADQTGSPGNVAAIAADADETNDDVASPQDSTAPTPGSTEPGGPGDSVDVAALATPVVESEPVIASRCVSLGPFINLGEAAVAASQLRSSGLDPRQRLAESDVWMGFWVHLPAYPSRAAAVAAVQGLRDKGVNDIYIEPGGELRNSVSLGVFSDRARADAHAGRVRTLGVEPRVTERYRQDQAYWIDVDLAEGQSVDASDFVTTASQSVGMEDGACDT